MTDDKENLIDAICGRGFPPDIRWCDAMVEVGLAERTGYQWNIGWKWRPSMLKVLEIPALQELYSFLRKEVQR